MYDENGERKYFGIYGATVVDNADPEALGRVRFRIDGMIEPSSGWAFPAAPGGAAQNGVRDVPKKGATVHAFFVNGDIDQPRFMGGWHGRGESPTQTPAPANADRVKIYETDRFLIVLNGIGGSEEILITDKTSGDKVSMRPSQLTIQSAAKVTVKAPQIEIGDDGLGNAPLINGVVLASGIDPLTGLTYGALGSASSVVTAKKA